MGARLAAASIVLGMLLALAPGGRAATRGDDPPAERAVLAYRAGDLETARVLFLEALEGEPRPAGRERARLFYALGNVSARQDDWRAAVGWYEAARRLRPRDADTWANLELARARAGFEPADRGDLASTVARLLGLWTPAESRLVALAGLLVAALALGFEALRGGPAGRRVALAGVLVLLGSAAPWARHLAASGRAPALVIAPDPLPLRSEPRGDAAPIGDLRPDSRVELEGTFLDWTRVRPPGGPSGWVPSQAVFALDRP